MYILATCMRGKKQKEAEVVVDEVQRAQKHKSHWDARVWDVLRRHSKQLLLLLKEVDIERFSSLTRPRGDSVHQNHKLNRLMILRAAFSEALG